MDIKSGRMVFLGYGKYWRSDRIVGLVPIEGDRGPGRRTDVFVEDRAQAIVASRTEDAILADLGDRRKLPARGAARGDRRATGSASRVLPGAAPGAAARAPLRCREVGRAAGEPAQAEHGAGRRFAERPVRVRKDT